MAWSYDSTLTTAKDQVRFLIRDTDTAKQQVQDEEILWLIKSEANIYMAAYAAGQMVVARTAAGAGVSSKSVGDLSISYGGLSDSGYQIHLKRLLARGSAHQVPSVGGISIADKDLIEADTDVPSSDFQRGMHDNPGTAVRRSLLLDEDL